MRDRVLGAGDAPIVFVKDMAYQAAPLDQPWFFGQLVNTFIIREPREALCSLHDKWPDFTLTEAGYHAHGRLFDLATRELEQPPVVVDATDLRRRHRHPWSLWRRRSRPPSRPAGRCTTGCTRSA